jgi:hypothetical protein
MCVALVALLALPLAAFAGVELDYVGSFKAGTGYYRPVMTFVPAGTNADRPAGKQINVPTLLTWGSGHSANDNCKEWYIPDDATLAKTSGDALPSAVQVTPYDAGSGTGEGGTLVQDGYKHHISWPAGLALMGNGRAYGMYGNSSTNGFGGEVLMGANEDWDPDGVTVVDQYPPRPDVAGQPTSHFAGEGGLAPVRGTTDTLAVVAYDSTAGDQKTVALGTSVQGAPDAHGFAWTTTTHFWFKTDYTKPASWPLEYVSVGGKDYYVLYDGTVGHTGGAQLLFFDADVFKNDGGGPVDATSGPTFSLDINAAMLGGWGWNDEGTGVTTHITDLAFDPDSGRLYVTENNPSGCRSGNQTGPIHVFELGGGAAAPIPEPSPLGWMALGLPFLFRRKRRNLTMRGKLFRRILPLLVLALLLAPLAAQAGLVPTLSLRTGPGGGPMIHDMRRGSTTATNPEGVAVRFSTGTIFSGSHNGTWYPLNLHDPALAFERGTGAQESRVGQGLGVSNTSNTVYDGAVSGGSNPTPMPSKCVLTYNPMTDTFCTHKAYQSPEVKELVFQTVAQGIGGWQEGTDTGAGRVDTLGYVSDSVSFDVSQHNYGAEWDARKDLDDGGGVRTVDRYFTAHRTTGASDNYTTTEIRLFHVEAAYATAPTTTAHGVKNASWRGGLRSQSVVLDATALAGLVPGIADDARGWAVLDDVLYVVSRDAANGRAYLAGVQYVIPDDPSLAITASQVDINPGDATLDYLDLTAMDAAINTAQDIAFDQRMCADGVSTMYLATGVGGDGNIYIFDVIAPSGAGGAIPEPAGLGLLGLALLSVRRRCS